MKTIEDTLVDDLVAYWTANRPAGLPEGWPIFSHRRQGEKVLPCVIVGHEGCQREKGKGEIDTGKVALRVMLVSDMDVTTPEEHQLANGAMDEALLLMETQPGPLVGTFVHAFLREIPRPGLDGRREYIEQRWTAVVSRYRES